MRIGDSIRSLREARGWAQVELAQAAGLARATIESLETNPDYSPRIETLQRVARALETHIGAFLGLSGSASPLLQQIASDVEAMPEHRQVLVAEVVRTMRFPAAMSRAAS